MVKLSELRALSAEELQAKSDELSRQIYALRNERRVARKMDRPHRIRASRRDRARALTVLREKTVT